MRALLLLSLSAAGALQFGLYDAQSDPGGGWTLMSVADITAHKAALSREYNERGGFGVVRPFRTGNCCVSVAGGDMLTVSGTKYGVLFPSTAGKPLCNPKSGYAADARLRFYAVAKLSDGQAFSSVAGKCKTHHNPALYMRADVVQSPAEFGLFDADLGKQVQEQGWHIMSEADFTKHRTAFIASYNANRGIKVIAPFKTGNCCVAVAGGRKLTITQTRFGIVFPATQSPENAIRCNPTAGMVDSHYSFYGAPTLSEAQVFGSKEACKVSHNPAVYMRARYSKTRAPTPAPTPQATHGRVECQVGEWGAWSACSTTCGEGRHRRHRPVLRAGTNGARCPRLAETKPCIEDECAVHCTVGEWTGWTTCDRECGGGKMERSRNIVVPPTETGDACPHLTEQASCNMHKCPIHCSVTKWQSWSKCSNDCGGGSQKRKRSVIVDAAWDGSPCPELEQTRACNAHACVDCGVSEWGPWSSCSKTCGGGTQERTRSVVQQAKPGGRACGALVDTRACGASDPCPKHCETLPWGTWSSCSTTCGVGIKLRSRTVLEQAAHGGAVCPALKQTAECEQAACAVDCKTGEWGDWSACSRTCGSGMQTRTRDVLVPAQHGGKCHSKQSRDCAVAPCATPKDIRFGIADFESPPGDGWELMGLDDFKQHQSQLVRQYNENGGAFNLISVFSSGNCAFSLKGGEKLVVEGTKFGFVFPAIGGKVHCNPSGRGYLHPKYGFYGLSKLSMANTFSSKEAYTTAHNPALYMKLPKQTHIEFGLFDADGTPAGGWTLMSVDDFATYRSEFAAAYNAHGGLATIKPFRSGNCCISVRGGLKLTVSHTKHGIALPADPATGRAMCNPKDGYAGKYKLYGVSRIAAAHSFGEKATCANSHNPGVFMRLPQSKHSLEFGMFDLQAAPVGGWKLASLADLLDAKAELVEFYNANSGFKLIRPFKGGNCCFAVAGGDKLIVSGSKYKWVFPAAVSGGIRCNPTGGYTDAKYQFYRLPRLPTTGLVLSQKAACATSHNPAIWIRTHGSNVDEPTKAPATQPPTTAGNERCKVSAWSKWGDCSKSCGGGVQKRTRDVTRVGSNGAAACPVLQQRRACREQDCPLHCRVSDFGKWSQCSAECGGGRMMRRRSVTQQPTANGSKCPHLSETAACNTYGCPVHCVMSKFTAWTPCSATCGGGQKTRRRAIIIDAAFNGNECEHEAESKKCGDTPCAVDCMVSHFDAWSPCTVSCGGGSQERRRITIRHVQHGGKNCPALSETRMCNKRKCPVDCKQEDWVPGACSVTCGKGHRRFVREVVREPAYGGKPCGKPKRTEDCLEGPCPRDCSVTEWGSWSTCSHTCGAGRRQRARSVTQHARSSGAVCPSLLETVSCELEPCAVDCQVTAWSEWSACTKTCGQGNTQSRTRSITIARAETGRSCPALQEQRDCDVSNCPVNCKMTVWSKWSQCSVTCGTGFHHRTRRLLTRNAYGGRPCPADREERPCRLAQCPIDCQAGEWTYSACSVTCGTGVRSRTRVARVEAQYGGLACPALHESYDCDEGPCPSHCDVSGWGAWSSCSVTCGTGRQTRTRKVLSHPTHGGYVCPSLSDAQPCVSRECPRKCVVSVWSAWSQCTRTCGSSATQSRGRRIVERNAFGGRSCPALRQQRACDVPKCPRDCVLEEWSSWSTCTMTCAGGTRSRSRTVKTEAMYGGLSCGVQSQSLRCAETPCPVACKVRSWSGWSICSKSCGGGASTRSREVRRNSANGGAPCPGTVERRPCNGHQCPRDCSVSQWSSWGECTRTCTPMGAHGAVNPGVHMRTRSVTRPFMHGGKTCPPLTQRRICGTAYCATGCVMTQWSVFGECSASCGKGTRKRVREITSLPHFGGTPCGATEDTQPCNAGPCPHHCTVSEWGPWTACTKTCGLGMMERRRAVTQHAEAGGYTCPSLLDTRECRVVSCPDDCVVGSWGTWGHCTKTCGRGIATRTRPVTRSPRDGGEACPPLSHTRICNDNWCPRDCKTSPWGAWSQCSKTCGTQGTQSRSRTVLFPAKYGGLDCPVLESERICDPGPCPVHCRVNRWGAWSGCSTTCGVGIRSRARTVYSHAAHGGYECPRLSQVSECQMAECPIDCQLEHWGTWSACSATCGGGQESRTRKVARREAFGGKPCASAKLRDDRPCVIAFCPVHCRVSEWGRWGRCSRTCGGGEKTRLRTVERAPKHGGKPCPMLRAVQNCHGASCPFDCTVTAWGVWGACSTTCEQGTRTRRRTVTEEQYAGGKSCPALTEEMKCNLGKCPVNCEISVWGAWSLCTKSCGVGTHSRSRTIITHADHGGFVCPALNEARECEFQPCSVDCVLRNWSPWSDCTASCGGGVQKRRRTVLVEADYGGKACGAQRQKRECNIDRCAIDCEVGPWGSYGACPATCGVNVHATRRRAVVISPANGGKKCPPLEQSTPCHVPKCIPHLMRFGLYDADASPGPEWRLMSIGDVEKHKAEFIRAYNENHGLNTIKRFQSGNCCITVSGGLKLKVDGGSIGYALPAGGGKLQCNPSGGYHGVYSFLNVGHLDLDQRFDAIDACKEDHNPGIFMAYEDPPQDQLAFGMYDAEVPPGEGWQLMSLEVLNQNRAAFVRQYNRAGIPLIKPFASGNCCVELAGGEKLIIAGSKFGYTFPAAKSGGIRCNPGAGYVDTHYKLYGVGELEEAQGFSMQTACASSHNPGIYVRGHTLPPTPAPTRAPTTAPTPPPQDCRVSAWSEWGDCSRTCGTGEQHRRRSVSLLAKHGGLKCPRLAESRQCNSQDCPVHCKLSKWSEWGLCSAPKCGGGTMQRTRTVEIAPKFNGNRCPALSESVRCNTQPCPVHCAVTHWSVWGGCDRTCGAGVDRRTRTVKVNAMFDGSPCPALEQTRTCNDFECPDPVNCRVSRFEIGSCSSSCGGGYATHRRVVLRRPLHGGIACPALTVTHACDSGPCPMHCKTSTWSDLTPCSRSCGPGVRTRFRKVLQHPAYGGYTCPALVQQHDCQDAPCATDCETGAWGKWSVCSASCGTGLQTRSRQVKVEAKHGGSCTHTQSQVCMPGPCVVESAAPDGTEFGIADLESPPGEGWELMSAEDIDMYRTDLVRFYNKQGGLDVIAPFKSGNCAIAVEGGDKLTISGTRYGFQFPELEGKITCNPPNGYLKRRYQFMDVDRLSTEQTFGAQPKYTTNHNPALYMRMPLAKQQHAAAEVEFGLFDAESTPPGQWELASAADLEQHKAAFVKAYNANGGLHTIGTFRTGNCCVTVKNGKKLTISDTKYGIQFPAQPASTVACNPTGGYSGRYQLFGVKSLSVSQTFGERTACATSHNPAIFFRTPERVAKLQFGIFDAETSPGEGWTLMEADDFNKNKEAFITAYNNDHGLAVIKPFQSGNCCFAVAGGEKLVISKTPYKWQFPAASGTGGIRCNPTGGYSDGRLQFFKSGKLTMAHMFTSTQACATSHNPAVYMRGGAPLTRRPTPAPTPKPTPAPIDCQVSEWTKWGDCSATCGAGVMRRKRTVERMAELGGSECPALEETHHCLLQDCAVHCAVGEFSAWSECTAKCGGGSMKRQRKVLQLPAWNGDACPHLHESAACNTHACPVHCELSPWHHWWACDRTCGTGQRRRERFIVVDAQFEGTPCPHLVDTKPCKLKACPTHCTVSSWSSWSSCSLTCGGGKQMRSRHIIAHAAHGGYHCPATSVTRECNKRLCPVDCVVGGWRHAGGCDRTCGVGQQKRVREVLTEPRGGGVSCGNLVKTIECKLKPCPVDCIVGAWSTWSACPVTCGAGLTTRSRTVSQKAMFGGFACPHLTMKKSCGHGCPIDCKVGSWGSFGKCSATCGNSGRKTRTRPFISPAWYGGAECPSLTEDFVCNDMPCPEHCEVSPWGQWSACSVSCGKGFQTRARTVLSHAAHGGYVCPNLSESQTCLALDSAKAAVACPVDCRVSRWTGWTACSRTCGANGEVGKQMRTRSVTTASEHGGSACPALAQSRYCKPTNGGKPCPVDCVVSKWSKWSTCTTTCGKNGHQVRKRTIVNKQQHGGRGCPILSDVQLCNQRKCPAQCTVSAWSSWTPCSASCGNSGVHHRTRKVTGTQHLGCPALSQSGGCNLFTCPPKKPVEYASVEPYAKVPIDVMERQKSKLPDRYPDGPKRVQYFPSLALECCRMECGNKHAKDTAARADCLLGCRLWLSTSSLNFEARRWHPLLLAKCKRDCTASRRFKDNKPAASQRVAHHRTDFAAPVSIWVTDATRTPSDEQQCMAGCTQYLTCISVKPATASSV